MSKPLPKSLHTITALIMVARHVQKQFRAPAGANLSNADALDRSLVILGYAGGEDPSDLMAKSLKSMDAEDAKRVVKAVA